MKRKLAFIFAAPLLFCVLGFQGRVARNVRSYGRS